MTDDFITNGYWHTCQHCDKRYSDADGECSCLDYCPECGEDRDLDAETCECCGHDFTIRHDHDYQRC